ncbi:heavy-metal-associated domain-containing protein [Paracoccus sediminicola]|uniref:heavy-metal-associated domain-containing protein n=1 Tax=Paracoccus sediminicola TaxID=3017783 RepID=UPI0022F00E0C|nr:heavy-metal-associated domain-containing protein [Paracoccus sediminicola]WBU57546.1 heavy-metal-associated domain-containing protein [Paracoccus sediminicola]
MRLIVPDMSCGHCKATIEEAVRAAGGTADVDLDARSVTIAGLDTPRAAEVIREAGFSPQAG